MNWNASCAKRDELGFDCAMKVRFVAHVSKLVATTREKPLRKTIKAKLKILFFDGN